MGATRTALMGASSGVPQSRVALALSVPVHRGADLVRGGTAGGGDAAYDPRRGARAAGRALPAPHPSLARTSSCRSTRRYARSQPRESRVPRASWQSWRARSRAAQTAARRNAANVLRLVLLYSALYWEWAPTSAAVQKRARFVPARAARHGGAAVRGRAAVRSRRAQRAGRSAAVQRLSHDVLVRGGLPGRGVARAQGGLQGYADGAAEGRGQRTVREYL